MGGLGGLLALDVRTGTLRDDNVPQTITWYLVAFVGFLAIAVVNERRPISAAWVWVLGVGLRIGLLFTTPTLSDDVYRYLWDGHLVASGVSPYRFAISDPFNAAFEIPARALANNPDLSSPYLPVANLAFGLLAVLAPSSPSVMQIAMVCLDLITAGLLVSALRAAGLPRQRVLLWLLNPLVIVEIAHGAHLDGLMLALFAGGLVLQLRRPVGHGSPFAMALATMTRPIPAFASIALFPRWSWPQRITWAGTIAVVCIPFGLVAGFGLESPATGTGLFGSARVYSDSFRFNSAIYQAVERETGSTATRAMAAVVFGVVVMVTMWRSRRLANSTDEALREIRLLAIPVVAYCLLTPVFHPWYLLIVVLLGIFHTPLPTEPVTRWLLMLPLVWLSATLAFSYLTYLDPNAHAELSWVRRLEWWPTLALGVGAWGMHQRRGKVAS